jgi:RNA polymerase sigma-70 factor (ECF subfamily)
MANPDEKALLEKARRFDMAALEAVYNRFSPGLYRYSFRLLGDAFLAEECVAETFSRFLKALRDGRGPGEHLQAYLYRIAHNWITDSYRRAPPPSIPLEMREDTASADRTEETAETGLRGRELRSAMRLLTPEQRQAVSLRFLEGWGNEEIAQAMKRPVGAVKALQQRGIAALRRLLLRGEGET